jgi:molecular chaperone GrpE
MNNEKEWFPKPAAEGEEASDRGPADHGLSGGGDAAPARELPADLPAAYQKLLDEKQDLHERLLRKQAELENVRKRVQREKEEFLQHATADLIRALLPVLDGFDRALKHQDEAVPEHFYQGMELVYRQLMEVLTRGGLAPIETVGKTFDPHFHQAVETVESPGHRDQEIVEELQRGYKLRSRLLRPAVVKVAVASQSPGIRKGKTHQEAE